MKKGTLILYLSQYKSIGSLSLEDKGRLLDSLFYYLEFGEEPQDMSPIVSLAFSFIRNRVDLDTNKYEERCRKNKENIKKRYERIQSYTKATDNDNDNVNDNVNDNDNGTSSTKVEDSKKEKIKKESNRISYAEIVNEFNKRFTGRLAVVKTLTDARKAAIKSRLAEHGPDSWKELFDKVDESDFLIGRNNRNWRADFDWLFRPSNFCKIIEGNYGNKENIRNNGGDTKGQNTGCSGVRSLDIIRV